MHNSQEQLEKTKPASLADVYQAGKNLIGFSQPIMDYYNQLRPWLMHHMYRHQQVNTMTDRARQVVAKLFDGFMADAQRLPDRWRDKLSGLDEAGRARQISDYIAGMTDRYALDEYSRLSQNILL
jgi:dGTPase